MLSNYAHIFFRYNRNFNTTMGISNLYYNTTTYLPSTSIIEDNNKIIDFLDSE